MVLRLVARCYQRVLYLALARLTVRNVDMAAGLQGAGRRPAQRHLPAASHHYLLRFTNAGVLRVRAAGAAALPCLLFSTFDGVWLAAAAFVRNARSVAAAFRLFSITVTSPGDATRRGWRRRLRAALGAW